MVKHAKPRAGYAIMLLAVVTYSQAACSDNRTVSYSFTGSYLYCIVFLYLQCATLAQ